MKSFLQHREERQEDLTVSVRPGAGLGPAAHPRRGRTSGLPAPRTKPAAETHAASGSAAREEEGGARGPRPRPRETELRLGSGGGGFGLPPRGPTRAESRPGGRAQRPDLFFRGGDPARGGPAARPPISRAEGGRQGGFRRVCARRVSPAASAGGRAGGPRSAEAGPTAGPALSRGRAGPAGPAHPPPARGPVPSSARSRWRRAGRPGCRTASCQPRSPWRPAGSALRGRRRRTRSGAGPRAAAAAAAAQAKGDSERKRGGAEL